MSKASIFLLKGSITKSNDVVDADIRVENAATNAVVKRLRSSKGKYVISLPANGQYKITYGGNKLPEQVIKLSTVGTNGYVERNQNIDLDVKPEILQETVTPTVSIAKVTPTVNTTPTISVTKTNTTVNTPTVAMVKNTTSVITTSTTALAKTNTITNSTTTLSTIKSNTASATPTTSVAKTNTVAATPTVASVKVTAPTIISSNTTAAAVVVSPTVPSSQGGVVRPANMTVENFVPLTAAQEKIKLYAEKYPDVSADSLDFRIQIAAFKNPKAYSFPHLKDCGKLENLLLEDGITRLTIGGSFKTLRAAYEHNKKVVVAGQNDAFVTVIYKRRRLALEELENMGIFKKK